MATTYIVTIGTNAYSFNDQVTGISIAKGEERELTARQYRTKRIQKALVSGHLVLVPDKNKTNKYTAEDIEKLDKKLAAQFAKGMEISKIAKSYSLEEVKLIAKKHEIEADPKDTVKDILEVLLEDFEENKE